VLAPDKQRELARLYASLNPLRLRREIDVGLEQLWALAVRPGTNNTRTTNTASNEQGPENEAWGPGSSVTMDSEAPIPLGNRHL
jgi:hypothetical protein